MRFTSKTGYRRAAQVLAIVAMCAASAMVPDVSPTQSADSDIRSGVSKAPDQCDSGWTLLAEWDENAIQVRTYAQQGSLVVATVQRSPNGTFLYDDDAYLFNRGQIAIEEHENWVTASADFWGFYLHPDTEADGWVGYLEVDGYALGLLMETGWGKAGDFGWNSDAALEGFGYVTEGVVEGYYNEVRLLYEAPWLGSSLVYNDVVTVDNSFSGRVPRGTYQYFPLNPGSGYFCGLIYDTEVVVNPAASTGAMCDFYNKGRYVQKGEQRRVHAGIIRLWGWNPCQAETAPTMDRPYMWDPYWDGPQGIHAAINTLKWVSDDIDISDKAPTFVISPPNEQDLNIGDIRFDPNDYVAIDTTWLRVGKTIGKPPATFHVPDDFGLPTGAKLGFLELDLEDLDPDDVTDVNIRFDIVKDAWQWANASTEDLVSWTWADPPGYWIAHPVNYVGDTPDAHQFSVDFDHLPPQVAITVTSSVGPMAIIHQNIDTTTATGTFYATYEPEDTLLLSYEWDVGCDGTVDYTAPSIALAVDDTVRPVWLTVTNEHGEKSRALTTYSMDSYPTAVKTPKPIGRFAIVSVHPNPANPTVTISYNVGNHRPVQVDIYDVRGRHVATLEKTIRAPGVYATTWDGIDKRGHRVASGVYFVRAISGELVDTRKIVILK